MLSTAQTAILTPKIHAPLLWCTELPLENSCLDKDSISWAPEPLAGAMGLAGTVSRAQDIKKCVSLLQTLSSPHRRLRFLGSDP